MVQHGRQKQWKRWSAAWGIAIVLHAAIIAGIAWELAPEPLVGVSAMIPPPGETVELFPAQAIQPAVVLSSKPDVFNPGAASLFKIEEDGTRTFVAHAHVHDKRKFAVQFDAVDETGIYEIEITENVVSEPKSFDGEFDKTLPSGDGNPGGTFRARFTLIHKAHEVMTASLYDPNSPMENEEPAQKSKAEKPQKPQIPTAKPQPKQKPKKKTKQKKSDAPKTPLVKESMSPVAPTTPTPDPAPALTPENLRISPMNFAPSLFAESAETAQEIFEKRDTNKFVEAARVSKARYEAAYNSDGPVIGPGQQGNSLSHQKDVAEYLALMHKEIHPLWAHGYLIRLDTMYRQVASRLNDPDLEAVLEITLNGRGDVVDVRIVKSSGITDYDSEAIHVAWNSSPKIPIPREMRSPNGKSYIHWTFWRDARQCGVFGVKVFKYNGTERDKLDFSLKAVQIQEKKLGLTPSKLNIPGSKKKNSNAPGTPKETPPLENINPLDD